MYLGIIDQLTLNLHSEEHFLELNAGLGIRLAFFHLLLMRSDSRLLLEPGSSGSWSFQSVCSEVIVGQDWHHGHVKKKSSGSAVVHTEKVFLKTGELCKYNFRSIELLCECLPPESLHSSSSAWGAVLGEWVLLQAPCCGLVTGSLQGGSLSQILVCEWHPMSCSEPAALNLCYICLCASGLGGDRWACMSSMFLVETAWTGLGVASCAAVPVRGKITECYQKVQDMHWDRTKC